MKFEWDEDKNIINKEKHKISFETAAYIFNNPYYIEMFGFEHIIDEDRYIAQGKSEMYCLQYLQNEKKQFG